MFTANGKHEIRIYVFLRILGNNLMAGQDSIKLPDFGAVEKSHMYVLTTGLYVPCPHTDGSLLKILKKEDGGS